MHFEWLQASQKRELEAWDAFLIRSPRGHFCQLSTWLASFSPYRFTYLVLIAREVVNGPIVGGVGLLQFGNRVFGYLCAPIGPIVEVGFEHYTAPIIEAALDYAGRAHMAVVQFLLPYSSDGSVPAVLSEVALPDNYNAYAGEPFVNAPTEMLLVDFPCTTDYETWRETLLLRFRQQTRRHIRAAERSGLEIHECRGEEESRAAFSIIEASGRLRNYPTREWKDFGPTLLEQVHRGQAVLLAASRGGHLLGVHYGVIAGQRYTAVMAGTDRTEGEGDVGYFLHWMAMRKARSLGLPAYDLTSSSVKGVSQFKMGFRPTLIHLGLPRYFVLSSWRYAAFQSTYRLLRNHKPAVAGFLKFTAHFAPRSRRGSPVVS